MPSAPYSMRSYFRRTFSTSACVRASIRASIPEITGRIVEVREALRATARQRRVERPGRLVRAGRLQRAGDGRREPAVRRGHRTGTDRQGAGRQRLFPLGAAAGRIGSETLYKMGLEIADNAIELFADLPADHPFFQQLAFMTAEDIPEYQQLLQRLRGKSIASGFRRRPRQDHQAQLRLYRTAASLRPAHARTDGQDRGRAAPLLRRTAGGVAGRDRALRSAKVHDRRDAERQRPVRPHCAQPARRTRAHPFAGARTARHARPL